MSGEFVAVGKTTALGTSYPSAGIALGRHSSEASSRGLPSEAILSSLDFVIESTTPTTLTFYLSTDADGLLTIGEETSVTLAPDKGGPSTIRWGSVSYKKAASPVITGGLLYLFMKVDTGTTLTATARLYGARR